MERLGCKGAARGWAGGTDWLSSESEGKSPELSEANKKPKRVLSS